MLSLLLLTVGLSAHDPVVAQPIPKKGLAWAHPEFTTDLQTLGATWWYVWGVAADGFSGPPGYVPMSRCGERVALPADYAGPLLVFNEPNNPEPYGCALDPAEAAHRYVALTQAHPHAAFVVGGFSIWALDWLRAFDDAVERLTGSRQRPSAVAVHAYVESWITPDEIEQRLLELESYAAVPVWVTEFGACADEAAAMQRLVDFFERTPWIERYAAFTNRQLGSEPWAICSGVALLTWDGAPTPAGRVYQQAGSLHSRPTTRHKQNREASVH